MVMGRGGSGAVEVVAADAVQAVGEGGSAAAPPAAITPAGVVKKTVVGGPAPPLTNVNCLADGATRRLSVCRHWYAVDAEPPSSGNDCDEGGGHNG